MIHKEKRVSLGGTMILALVILNVIVIREAFVRDESWYSALFITLPLLAWFYEQELLKDNNNEQLNHN